MKRFCVLAFLVYSLMINCYGAAGKNPDINVTYNYYKITGKTAEELRQQMNKKGIKWTDGKVYDAFTKWFVEWRYTYKSTGKQCSMDSVRTSLEVTYTLPQWIDKKSAAPELQKKWETYISILKKHEEGHMKFGVDASQEIQRTISELKPMVSCDELGETANKLGYQILEKYRTKEREYDAETEHGKTQGAVFP